MLRDNSLTTPADMLQPVGLALVAHSLWGSYPVLSKLLLSTFDFPPLVFVASAQLAALIAALFLARRDLRWSILWHPMLVGMALATVTRGISNIFAIKLTLSIYVQLITLLAPFTVAILGRMIFDETPPPHTFKATLAATTGAAMTLLGNPRTLSVRFGPGDILGIGLALIAMVALAFWQHFARIGTSKHAIQPAVALVVQSFVSVVVISIVGLGAGQDWGIWLRLPASGWALFGLIAIAIFIGGSIWQMRALSRLKAAFYASLTPWRLVVALAGGALLLGERLESVTQVVGALLVIVTVTLYLRQRVVNPGAAA